LVFPAWRSRIGFTINGDHCSFGNSLHDRDLFYLQSLQTEEASTVAPFFQAAGIIGLILGYFVLGEKISLLQIISVLLIIAGSALLSLRFGQGTRRVKTHLVILMLACALAIALSSLIFKFFAVRDEYWITTFWNFAGQILFGAILIMVFPFIEPAWIPGNLGRGPT
jgi:drug/metabolite transporter (DMT)-like permease